MREPPVLNHMVEFVTKDTRKEPIDSLSLGHAVILDIITAIKVSGPRIKLFDIHRMVVPWTAGQEVEQCTCADRFTHFVVA